MDSITTQALQLAATERTFSMGIEAIFTIGAAIAGLIGAGIKTWQTIKAAKKDATKWRDLAAQADTILNAALGVMHVIPNNSPQYQRMYETTLALSNSMGANTDVVADRIDQVVGALKNAGIKLETDNTSPADVQRAAAAIAAMQTSAASLAASDPPKPPSAGGFTPRLAGIFILAASIAACVMGCSLFQTQQDRLTTEILMPGNASAPNGYLTVQWPKGIEAGQVHTVQAADATGEQRAVSVAQSPVIVTSDTRKVEAAK